MRNTPHHDWSEILTQRRRGTYFAARVKGQRATHKPDSRSARDRSQSCNVASKISEFLVAVNRRLRLLHLAVFEGSVDTVLLLLSAGASPNAQDLDGWTTLHYAARNETGGEVLVRTLLVAGAEADKTTNRGRTGEWPRFDLLHQAPVSYRR